MNGEAKMQKWLTKMENSKYVTKIVSFPNPCICFPLCVSFILRWKLCMWNKMYVHCAPSQNYYRLEALAHMSSPGEVTVATGAHPLSSPYHVSNTKAQNQQPLQDHNREDWGRNAYFASKMWTPWGWKYYVSFIYWSPKSKHNLFVKREYIVQHKVKQIGQRSHWEDNNWAKRK